MTIHTYMSFARRLFEMNGGFPSTAEQMRISSQASAAFKELSETRDQYRGTVPPDALDSWFEGKTHELLVATEIAIRSATQTVQSDRFQIGDGPLNHQPNRFAGTQGFGSWAPPTHQATVPGGYPPHMPMYVGQNVGLANDMSMLMRSAPTQGSHPALAGLQMGLPSAPLPSAPSSSMAMGPQTELTPPFPGFLSSPPTAAPAMLQTRMAPPVPPSAQMPLSQGIPQAPTPANNSGAAASENNNNNTNNSTTANNNNNTTNAASTVTSTANATSSTEEPNTTTVVTVKSRIFTARNPTVAALALAAAHPMFGPSISTLPPYEGLSDPNAIFDTAQWIGVHIYVGYFENRLLRQCAEFIPYRFSAFHETQRKIEEVIVLAERANDRTDANLIAERIIGIYGRMHGPLNGWTEASTGHGNNNGKKGSFIGGFRRSDYFSRLTARLREAVVDAKL